MRSYSNGTRVLTLMVTIYESRRVMLVIDAERYICIVMNDFACPIVSLGFMAYQPL